MLIMSLMTNLKRNAAKYLALGTMAMMSYLPIAANPRPDIARQNNTSSLDLKVAKEYHSASADSMAAVIKDKTGQYGGVADTEANLNEQRVNAADFYHTIQDYANSEQGARYLDQLGYSIDDLDGIGAVDNEYLAMIGADNPEKTIAALITFKSGEKVMVTNGRFGSNIGHMKEKYGDSVVEEFVIEHELAHANGEHDEIATAQKQIETYTKLAGKAREEGNRSLEKKYDTKIQIAKDYIAQQKGDDNQAIEDAEGESEHMDDNYGLQQEAA